LDGAVLDGAVLDGAVLDGAVLDGVGDVGEFGELGLMDSLGAPLSAAPLAPPALAAKVGLCVGSGALAVG
jgi:hypothetical protein